MDAKLVSLLQQFGAEPDAAMRGAASLSPTVTVAAGASIARKEQAATHLHLVVDGWAHGWRDLRDGRRQTVALALPGEFLDLEVLASGEREACITALSPCRVALLPLPSLRRLADQEPSLRGALGRLSARDGRVAREWMISLGRRSAMERIAHLLCEIAVRLDGPPQSDTVQFPFPLTQSDLADATGLSVVHVNRSLQALRRQVGLVLERRRMTIASWTEMAGVAEFDPCYLAADHGDHLRDRHAHARHAALTELRSERV